MFERLQENVDWLLVGTIVPLLGAGLVTMHSFVGDNSFFFRQIIWILLGFCIFFATSLVDWRFLRRTRVLVWLYIVAFFILVLLFLLGTETLGAISRFDLGVFFVQPSDPIKLVLILVLAKYFSRRHVEIAHYKHILISGLYTFILFVLVFLQGDLVQQ